jgi:ADP-heptose:LPS heptosyltransferase
LAAILAECDLFIGNDSGPLHIATAVGTPVVGIYGGMNDPRECYPWGNGCNRFIYSKVPCSPCGKTNCDTFICMNKIVESDVENIITKELSRIIELKNKDIAKIEDISLNI